MMHYLITASCWISVLILNSLYCVKSSDLACREAIFETVYKGQVLEEYVISSHRVNSWFECSEKCLDTKDCVTFSHRTTSSDNINCMLANQLDNIIKKNSHEVNTWTTYEKRKDELEICSTQQPCKNAGSCVRNSCEPEGYNCICSEWYYGKHCENENSDFDVVFSSQNPVLSYIEMDNIKSDLTQFTITAWFKFTIGLTKYNLLSYKTSDGNNVLNVRFSANSQSVTNFLGKILQHNEDSYMIPVNDNVWHHLGFVWSNMNGRWDVLIDGTPRAMRDSVEAGKVIAGGGTLVIGQYYTTSGFQEGAGLLGKISGVNIWDKALTGEEVEAMAYSRGHEKGNLLRWFNVVNNTFGNIQVVMPSNAHNTNKDLDYELQFDSGELAYVTSSGPLIRIDQLAVCLWLKTAVTSTFVYYHVEGETGPAFQFGITSSKYLFGKINGSLARSHLSDNRIVNNNWHFICITWNGLNGNVIFYYEGTKQGATVSGPITHLSPQGTFSIGVTKDLNSGTYSSSFVGKLSCVNIWSYIQTSKSIVAMASGVMNVNGDLLAWRDVQGHIIGNLTVVSSTKRYFPGYGLLARRSVWCNSLSTSLSCGTLYARLGEETGGFKMAWRCYCASALHESKYAYNFGVKSSAYVTKHNELLAIN